MGHIRTLEECQVGLTGWLCVYFATHDAVLMLSASRYSFTALVECPNLLT